MEFVYKVLTDIAQSYRNFSCDGIVFFCGKYFDILRFGSGTRVGWKEFGLD